MALLVKLVEETAMIMFHCHPLLKPVKTKEYKLFPSDAQFASWANKNIKVTLFQVVWTDISSDNRIGRIIRHMRNSALSELQISKFQSELDLHAVSVKNITTDQQIPI